MAQNSQIAFAPLGDTVVVPAAASAPTGVQALVSGRLDAQGTGQYRIINDSVYTVFLGIGSTAALATANAVAPIAGTPSSAIVHESGEVMECGLLHVPAAKQDPQGYGSALTYARRYSLLAATGLAPEDDDGNSASRRTEIKSTVDEHKIADLLAAMDEVTTLKELQETYKAAYKATNGEQTWQTKVIAKKDAKKAQIEGGK